MPVGLAAGLIMGSLVLALALGIPVAFSLIGVALIFALVLLGTSGLFMLITATWHQISSEVMLAIPLFVLMATILEFSGIGKGLFNAAYKWFGGLRGGLAIAVVLVCTLLAAITGLGATGVVIMGVLGLPEMYKRGYDKNLALGCIPAAGSLGPIIPPSVYMVILAVMAEQSVGRVFMGGVFPGLLIAALFCIYIAIRSTVQPGYAPGIPRDERASWKEKLVLLKGLVLPILLILAVLGTIYGGIATPTEAASIGAAGALLVSIVHRQFSWQNIVKAVSSSLLLTSLIMWIAIGGVFFAGVLRASGVANVIHDSIAGLPLSASAMLALMLVIALALGCFIDGLAIIMISIPIFVPIAQGLGINPVFFVVVYTIAIVIGLITPPFGMNLFYLKGIAPDEKIGDIYRASVPFCILMIAALFIIVAFPEIVTWLPDMMIGK
ncbi:MAG: TRAP transporter large permease subunit [Chloroflexi bacterium]|nr:TRAP transporter large permease subunit [Chloroflexota bacterium]